MTHNFTFCYDFTGLQSFPELELSPLITTADWAIHSCNGKEYNFNLARIGFIFEDENGNIIPPHRLQKISQAEEKSGALHSRFTVDGELCNVRTTICKDSCTIEVIAECPLIKSDRMYVNIALPYPSHEPGGSDWLADDKHQSQLYHITEAGDAEFNESTVERNMNDMRLNVSIKAKNSRIGHRLTHKYFIKSNDEILHAFISFKQ